MRSFGAPEKEERTRLYLFLPGGGGGRRFRAAVQEERREAAAAACWNGKRGGGNRVSSLSGEGKKFTCAVRERGGGERHKKGMRSLPARERAKNLEKKKKPTLPFSPENREEGGEGLPPPMRKGRERRDFLSTQDSAAKTLSEKGKKKRFFFLLYAVGEGGT